jgi:hypothetical protein
MRVGRAQDEGPLTVSVTPYDVFVIPGPRDWLDYLAAAGPTIAALTAAGVAWWQAHIARVTFEYERELRSPRIAIDKGMQLMPNATQLIVSMTNEGESRAIIETLDVQVDGITMPFDPVTQTPTAYWEGVLQALGIIAAHIAVANGIVTAFRIKAGDSKLLMQALAHGQNDDLAVMLRDRLKIKGTYSSLWGDIWNFPMPKPLPGQKRKRDRAS